MVRKVPEGTSAYQSAWLSDDDDDEEFEADEINNEERRRHPKNDKMLAEDDDEEESDSSDHGGSMEEEDLLKSTESEDVEFPDEVDTPTDAPARIRFQKWVGSHIFTEGFRYRGLKSFRSSPWNPKENLPAEYGKIFQFKNYHVTNKRIIATTTGSSSIHVTILLLITR